MGIKKIGNWQIEYPASCNGNPASNRLAFIKGLHASGFVSLYGNGNIGFDVNTLPPKSVVSYLENLSRNL